MGSIGSHLSSAPLARWLTGSYHPRCAYDQWYGDNCETSENDCLVYGGAQTCANDGKTCTDCSRQMANPAQDGYPVPNPDCQQGYTCGAEADDACADDPRCTDTTPSPQVRTTPSWPGSWANSSLS